MQDLFFEILRVAIGAQDKLSRQPKACEWIELYKIANKQSLIGVCFAALQKLGADADEGFARIGISETLYLAWMGMSAMIHQKNEVFDRQCAELQTKLTTDGFNVCVLKGQGVATLYDEHLHGLRQCGDIDVLMWKPGLSFHKNKQEVIAYAQNIDASACGSEHHVGVHLFDGTDVEMHYAPAYFCNPLVNKRFRRWCEEHRSVMDSGIGFNMPNTEFNLVFLLSHIFRHYMSEGVGLRQFMDYYFVLKTLSISALKGMELKKTLNSLNMLKFAGAVMWIMKDVFGIPEQYLICDPNERLGRKLLDHVMQGGNFGHHTTRIMASRNTHIGRFINQLTLDLSLAIDYPSEALWAPIAMIREFFRVRL